jgi:hypothetical protein
MMPKKAPARGGGTPRPASTQVNRDHGPASAIAQALLVSTEALREVVREEIAALHIDRGPERPFDRRGLAEFLGCSVDTVDRLRREGLPRIRVGDVERFERKPVLAWLRGRE